MAAGRPDAGASRIFQEMSAMPTQALVKEMRNNPDNIEIQTAGCDILSFFDLSDAGPRSAAGLLGAVELVTSAMKRHAANSPLQAAGCRGLGGLSKDDRTNQDTAVDESAFDLLLPLMRSADSELAAAALFATDRIVSYHSRNRRLAAEAGVIDAVVKAMESNATVPVVQLRGAGALQALVLHEKENQGRAGQAGAVKCVLDAMQKHKTNERVQAAVALALQNLIFAHAVNQEEAGNIGVVEVLIGIMRYHFDSKEVQQHCCGALWNLIKDQPANHERAIAARAESAIRQAINGFPGYEAVQEHACGVLSELRGELIKPGSKNKSAKKGLDDETMKLFHTFKPHRKGYSSLACGARGEAFALNNAMAMAPLLSSGAPRRPLAHAPGLRGGVVMSRAAQLIRFIR